jgi:hypothetical protein
MFRENRWRVMRVRLNTVERNMAKRVDLSLTIELPDGHNSERLSIDPDGRVRVFDKNGNEVVPVQVARATHYDRAKGRKYQAQVAVEQGYASVGGLEELARLDSFVVIDTNTVEINRTKVSVAFFIVCKLIPEQSGFRLTSADNRGPRIRVPGSVGQPRDAGDPKGRSRHNSRTRPSWRMPNRFRDRLRPR